MSIFVFELNDAALLGGSFAILNTFISAFVLIAMVATLYFQMEALADQKGELKRQAKAQETMNELVLKQSFENTFFNLLDNIQGREKKLTSKKLDRIGNNQIKTIYSKIILDLDRAEKGLAEIYLDAINNTAESIQHPGNNRSIDFPVSSEELADFYDLVYSLLSYTVSHVSNKDVQKYFDFIIENLKYEMRFMFIIESYVLIDCLGNPKSAGYEFIKIRAQELYQICESGFFKRLTGKYIVENVHPDNFRAFDKFIYSLMIEPKDNWPK